MSRSMGIERGIRKWVDRGLITKCHVADGNRRIVDLRFVIKRERCRSWKERISRFLKRRDTQKAQNELILGSHTLDLDA